MMNTKRTSGRGLLAACTLSFLALSTLAQDQDQGDPDFPTMEELLGGGPTGVQETAEQRMRRLFGEVETKLVQVDVLLTDAAAGDTGGLTEAAESGISELLKSSLERGRSAQKDIDQILEIARQLSAQQQQQSSGGGQPQSQGETQSENQGSPLDRGNNQSQRPETTPELPGEEQNGQEPQGQQQGGQDPQQQGQEPQQPGEQGQDPQQQGGQDPLNPGGDPNAPGDNRDGSERSDGAAGDAARGAGDEGWGNLPAHVRDTFRSEGRSELPARYRDWIDAYYKKLNQRGSRR